MRNLQILGATRPACVGARRGLAYYRAAYSRWRIQMGQEGIRPVVREWASCPAVRRLAALWRSRAFRAQAAFKAWYGRTYEKWRCIHEHEGRWNDPDPPYWGGLQMTYAFQQAHGPRWLARWGTADHWPIWAQLLAAEDAWRRDGGSFREWGTAGRCGLA